MNTPTDLQISALDKKVGKISMSIISILPSDAQPPEILASLTNVQHGVYCTMYAEIKRAYGKDIAFDKIMGIVIGTNDHLLALLRESIACINIKDENR